MTFTPIEASSRKRDLGLTTPLHLSRRRHARITRRDALWLRRAFGTATALVFSALAPALLMTAIWSDPRVAPMVFVFTFVIALSHAVPLGLPVFLIFRFRGWAGITACVVLGFAIGAIPAGILTFPMSGLALYARAWAGGTTPTNGISAAAIWLSYIKPLLYLGLLGAFGGLVFWLVQISCGTARYLPSERCGCNAKSAP